MPKLNKLYRTYKSQGLVLLGIHSDKDWAKGKATIKQHKVAFPVGQDANNATLRAYKVMAFPTVFVIDRKGVVRAVDPANLEAAVKSALAKK